MCGEDISVNAVELKRNRSELWLVIKMKDKAGSIAYSINQKSQSVEAKVNSPIL